MTKWPGHDFGGWPSLRLAGNVASAAGRTPATLFGADKRDKGWGYPRRAPAAILLALTACAQTPPTRYISTYCITKTQLEQLKAQEPGKVHDQLNGDSSHDIKPIAGNAVRLRAYADGLLVVLGGCIDPNKP